LHHEGILRSHAQVRWCDWDVIARGSSRLPVTQYQEQRPQVVQIVNDRDELLTRVQEEARSGDCVLLMGARDPSLPVLGKKIVGFFGGEVGMS
jgi:hypothetical protein